MRKSNFGFIVPYISGMLIFFVSMEIVPKLTNTVVMPYFAAVAALGCALLMRALFFEE